MNFPETTRSLHRLPPNRRINPGAHIRRQEESGRIGRVSPDTELVPGKHTAADVNPLSFMAQTVGGHYVRQVQPGRQVQTNILIQSVEKADDQRIVARKEHAAALIAQMLHRDLASTTDNVRLLAMEDVELSDEFESKTRLQRLKDDNEMIDFCRRGLTIMISDFSALKQDDRLPFAPAVALKVDHPFDRAIPADVGVLQLSDGFELDTSREDELAVVNGRISAMNTRAVDTLQAAGTMVAGVVLNPEFEHGFYAPNVDHSLAKAVDRLR